MAWAVPPGRGFAHVPHARADAACPGFVNQGTTRGNFPHRQSALSRPPADPAPRWMWSTFLLGHYVPLSWMTLGLDYTLLGHERRRGTISRISCSTRRTRSSSTSSPNDPARRRYGSGDEDGPAGGDESRGAAALLFAVHPLRVRVRGLGDGAARCADGVLLSPHGALVFASAAGAGGRVTTGSRGAAFCLRAALQGDVGDGAGGALVLNSLSSSPFLMRVEGIPTRRIAGTRASACARDLR